MDDSAIQWSNYESQRAQIAYQTSLQILAVLDSVTNAALEEGRSQEFIHGLEVATQPVRRHLRH